MSATQTTSAPSPRDGVMKIPCYVPGQSRIAGISEPIKLSSNESSFGPSPKAIAAYRAAADSLNRYPDGAQTALREAIAVAHGLDPARIVCGNGSDELIQMLIRCFAGAGDEVLLSENGFLMCRIHALAQGAEVLTAPERDFRIDVDALIARIGPRTRVLCLANPNNPTGTYLPIGEIRRLHDALPPNVILLLDGAYAEYVMSEDFDAGAGLVQENHNVIMTRTFSKIYGLPALRIGWAYASGAIVDALQRIRTPFNTNAPALAAAAAAVLDQPYIETIRRHNADWLQRIAHALRELGLEVVPSVANFYLIRFVAAGPASARGAAAFLLENGIIPRPVGPDDAGIELRITVGTDAENLAVLDTLARYMQHAR